MTGAITVVDQDAIAADSWLASQAPERLSRPALGERELMAAVLEEAKLDVAVATARLDALAWFWSDDTAWPYSFVNVCAVLDLDAPLVRAQLCWDHGITIDEIRRAQNQGS